MFGFISKILKNHKRNKMVESISDTVYQQDKLYNIIGLRYCGDNVEDIHNVAISITDKIYKLKEEKSISMTTLQSAKELYITAAETIRNYKSIVGFSKDKRKEINEYGPKVLESLKNIDDMLTLIVKADIDKKKVEIEAVNQVMKQLVDIRTKMY